MLRGACVREILALVSAPAFLAQIRAMGDEKSRLCGIFKSGGIGGIFGAETAQAIL